MIDYNPASLLKHLQTIFNLSLITPKIDLCISVLLKDKAPLTLCMKNGFLQKHKNINQYTLLNCVNISNYHGYISSANFKTNKLHRYVNGLEKVNIYTPIINFLLPKHIRTNRYPSFTSSLLGSALYGWSADEKAELHIKKLKSRISELDSMLRSTLDISLGIRAEFRIPIYNIFSAIEFAKSFILDKRYFVIESRKIKEVLINGLSIIIDLINNNYYKICDLNQISNAVLTEQSFFEYYIRGGTNLNILPKRAREFIGTYASEYNIKPMPDLIQFAITHDERTLMLNRLIKYNKLLSIEAKNRIHKLLQFISIIDSNVQIDQMIRTYKKEMIKLSHCSESLFLTGSSKNSRKTTTPLAFSEFFASQFLSPPPKFKSSLYIGMYNYLSFILNRELKQILLDRFINSGIRYFPEVSGKIVVAREIIYGSNILSTELDSKLSFVRESIFMGFYHTSQSQIHVATANTRKREPDVSQSEFMLLYYAYYKDPTILDQRLKLYNDLRYPFKYYCNINRIKTGTRTLLSKLKNGVDYDDLLGNFNISNFQITHLVLFLNLNGRSFGNAEAIKTAEELLDFANNRPIFHKTSDFYKSLYSNQINCSKSNDLYRRIFHSNFDSVHKLLNPERNIIPSTRLASDSNQIEIIDNSTDEDSNNTIQTITYNPIQNSQYMLSPPNISFNLAESSELELVENEASLLLNEDSTINLLDNPSEDTNINFNPMILNELQKINNIAKFNDLHFKYSNPYKNMMLNELEEMNSTSMINTSENSFLIKYNPGILNELENLKNISLLDNNNNYDSSSDSLIPGINLDHSEHDSITEMNISSQSNPFYKLNSNYFQITDDGIELIRLLKMKVKRNFIVLEMARLEIKEWGYDFDQTIDFFCIMEKHGYVLRKPKSYFSIFKFTNKFQF